MAKNVGKKNTTFYLDYSYAQDHKKPKGKAKIFFVFSLIILLVFVVIFSINKKNSKQNTFKNSCYLLVVGNFNFVSDAKEVADRIEKVGGAGFIWVDKTFEVIAFAYPNEKSIAKVKNNLDGTSWQTSIKKVNISQPKKSKLNKTQLQSTKYLWNLMSALYNLAIDFDAEKISNANAHKKLTKISKELNQFISSFGNDSIDVALCTRFQTIKTEIDEFLKKSYAKNLYSSGIKLICLKTIYACSTLKGEAN